MTTPSCMPAAGTGGMGCCRKRRAGSEQGSDGGSCVRTNAVARARRGPVKLEGIPHGQVDTFAVCAKLVRVFIGGLAIGTLIPRALAWARSAPTGACGEVAVGGLNGRLHRASAGSSSRLASSAGIARRIRLKSR